MSCYSIGYWIQWSPFFKWNTLKDHWHTKNAFQSLLPKKKKKLKWCSWSCWSWEWSHFNRKLIYQGIKRKCVEWMLTFCSWLYGLCCWVLSLVEKIDNPCYCLERKTMMLLLYSAKHCYYILLNLGGDRNKFANYFAKCCY